MTSIFSLWKGLAGRLALRPLALLGLLLLLLGRAETADASHIRAGDIQARADVTNPRRIYFKLTIYTDRFTVTGAANSVLQDSSYIFFGDGTCTKPRAVPRNERIGGPFVPPTRISPDTDVNFYHFEHTYPTSGRFEVSMIGENRNDLVLNLTRSATQAFYISTIILIEPALRGNRSAVLNAPAIDKGATGQVFLHNPAAFDADGDSLDFELIASQDVPLGVPGVTDCRPQPRIANGFRFPQVLGGVQVRYEGVPRGREGEPGILVQDRRTGQITWNSPREAGIYNIAFRVKEFRRTPFGVDLIGEVIRDMQIVIQATNNLRPTIRVPNDTCVIAGATVVGKVSATDVAGPNGDRATAMKLTAISGILPPATFVQTLTGPPLATGRFEWKTECANIASEPYQVLFSVQDTPPTGSPLIDQKVWRITVVGPPPQNLQATPGPTANGNTTQLTWNSYECQTVPGARMLIFRKENSTIFNPSTCETGIPAGLGYRQIGNVSAADRSFLDDNAGRGLERGKTYCYRIYAEFPLPAGGKSIASREACINFAGRPAVLTNVDVNRTSATDGQILVRWTRPVAPVVPGQPVPARAYRLARAAGLTPAAADFTTILDNRTDLLDTVFVDNNLDTQLRQYTYRLEVLTPAAGQPAPNSEASPTASSVRLTAAPNGLTKTITVSWACNVPWDNTVLPTRVFRRLGAGGAFVEVGTATSTATGGTYTDRDATLQLDQTYCYYVQTEGRYAGVPYLQSLLNKSQEQCVALTSEPCAPVLTVRPINCDSLATLGLAAAPLGQNPHPVLANRYENRLRWTLGSTPAGCSNTNISSFNIYYRPTEEGELTLIGSTGQLSFVHRNLPGNAGCYAVQAVDAAGRRSPLSNIVCIDNCQFFVLPNIFTPNGDNLNATFRPRLSSPVTRVRFQAFNRWGVKVYESDRDPLINWDGGGARSEASGAAMVSGGIYYYLAEVEFADFKRTKRTYKGWVEIVR